jgi:hypothetical protein
VTTPIGWNRPSGAKDPAWMTEGVPYLKKDAKKEPGK